MDIDRILLFLYHNPYSIRFFIYGYGSGLKNDIMDGFFPDKTSDRTGIIHPIFTLVLSADLELLIENWQQEMNHHDCIDEIRNVYRPRRPYFHPSIDPPPIPPAFKREGPTALLRPRPIKSRNRHTRAQSSFDGLIKSIYKVSLG